MNRLYIKGNYLVIYRDIDDRYTTYLSLCDVKFRMSSDDLVFEIFVTAGDGVFITKLEVDAGDWLTSEAGAVAYTVAQMTNFLLLNTANCNVSSSGGNETGIETFFISAEGNTGVGVSWADLGFVGDMPVVLYDNNANEKASFIFASLKRFKLDIVNPILTFTVYTTALPVLNEAVQWTLECRYIATGEKPTAIVNQTLVQTQTLTILNNNIREIDLSFTLDKSLIVDQDVMIFSLFRNGGNILDTYGADIAIGTSAITLETYTHNP